MKILSFTFALQVTSKIQMDIGFQIFQISGNSFYFSALICTIIPLLKCKIEKKIFSSHLSILFPIVQGPLSYRVSYTPVCLFLTLLSV